MRELSEQPSLHRAPVALRQLGRVITVGIEALERVDERGYEVVDVPQFGVSHVSVRGLGLHDVLEMGFGVERAADKRAALG